MNSVILEARSLTKEYKQTLALDHINLQIKKGKIYGFIGQNGAGKTTFLRLVTGLAFPTSGTLSLWGKSETVELQKQRIHRNIPASFDHFFCFSLNMFCFHKQRHRYASRIQCPLNHLWTFGNKHSFFRMRTVQQLIFGQPRVHIQLRCHKIRYFYSLTHCYVHLCSNFFYYPKMHARLQVYS